MLLASEPNTSQLAKALLTSQQTLEFVYADDSVAPPEFAFAITLESGKIRIQWDDAASILEEAEHIGGPWTPVQNQTAKAHTAKAGGDVKFFRLAR